MLRQKALEHNPPAFDVDFAKEARRPAASSEMSRNLLASLVMVVPNNALQKQHYGCKNLINTCMPRRLAPAYTEKIARTIHTVTTLTFGLLIQNEHLYTCIILARIIVLRRDMIHHTNWWMWVLPLSPDCKKQVYDEPGNAMCKPT